MRQLTAVSKALPAIHVLPENLFAPNKAFFRKFMADRRTFASIYERTDSIVLPINVDTEFETCRITELKRPGPFDEHNPPYTGISAQVRGIYDPNPEIYDHADIIEIAAETDRETRHKAWATPFVALEYLRDRDVIVDMRRENSIHSRPEHGGPDEKLPKLTVIMYAHFAIADLYKIGQGEFLDDLVAATANKKLVMRRRLNAETLSGDLSLDWVVGLNGADYRLAIRIVDTAGLHGIASYAAIASNVGVALPDKGSLDDLKTQMIRAYFERPEIFDRYAVGDLMVYDVLAAYDKALADIYAELGVGPYYQRDRCTKLTIGATVAALFDSVIAKRFDENPDMLKSAKARAEFYADKTTHSTAKYLGQQVSNDVYLLSKCDGGRCANERPTVTTLKGALCDIDIGGAYGTAMSIMPYPIGVPVIEAPSNKPTLRKWLFRHREMLVPRAWYARISTTQDLAFEQDLIGSWYDFRRKLHRKQDTDGFHVTGEVDLDSGMTKLLSREIVNGAFTSDILDWLENVCSDQQRNDFLDNVRVEAWAYYPASKRCRDVADWREKSQDHNPAKGESHHWFSLSMGELLIDDLRSKRNMHPKKSPMNELYKLFGNTSYGISVSRFFPSSNVIVGNNITATVRVYMWMLSKSLRGVQAITDGCAFDLNKVMHPHKGQGKNETSRLRAHYLVRPNDRKWREGKVAPLGGIKVELSTENDLPVLVRGESRLVGKAATDWVDQAAAEHVAKCFPTMPTATALHRRLVKRTDGIVEYQESSGLFDLEMKSFITKAAFHGSANYRFDLLVPDLKGATTAVKMRSYEARKPHLAVDVDPAGTLVFPDTYADCSPAEAFLGTIIDRPHKVVKLPMFAKTVIVKPGDFAHRWKPFYEGTYLAPGDNGFRSGVPRVFSVSQYRFKNRKQLHLWARADAHLKASTGESFEMFFESVDGSTVDYKRMTREIDRLIADGCSSPLAALDLKGARRIRRGEDFGRRLLGAREALTARVREKCFDPDRLFDLEQDFEGDDDPWDNYDE